MKHRTHMPTSAEGDATGRKVNEKILANTKALKERRNLRRIFLWGKSRPPRGKVG